MALETTMKTVGLALSEAERRRVEHQLGALERRLINHPDPKAGLVLTKHSSQRQIEAELSVQVGPLGHHLISHQGADTVEHAVRLAVKDVERQLERRLAAQRGDPTFGVPSRRLPRTLRPAVAQRSAVESAADDSIGR